MIRKTNNESAEGMYCTPNSATQTRLSRLNHVGANWRTEHSIDSMLRQEGFLTIPSSKYLDNKKLRGNQ